MNLNPLEIIFTKLDCDYREQRKLRRKCLDILWSECKTFDGLVRMLKSEGYYTKCPSGISLVDYLLEDDETRKCLELSVLYGFRGIRKINFFGNCGAIWAGLRESTVGNESLPLIDALSKHRRLRAQL